MSDQNGRQLLRSERPRRSRWLRWLLAAGAVVLLGYAALLGAAHLVVARALPGLMTGKLRLSAQPAWSWLPGRVVLRELRLAPRRSGWVVEADRVIVTLSLRELLRGRVVVRDATAWLRKTTLTHGLLRAVQSPPRAVLIGGMLLKVSDLHRDRGRWRASAASVRLSGSALQTAETTIAIVHGEVWLDAGAQRVKARLGGVAAGAGTNSWTLTGEAGRSLSEPMYAELQAVNEWSWSSEDVTVRVSPRSSVTFRGSGAGVDVHLRAEKLTMTMATAEIDGSATSLRVDLRLPLPRRRGPLELTDVSVTADRVEIETSTGVGRVGSPVSAALDLRVRRGPSWTIDSGTVDLPELASVPPSRVPLAPISLRMTIERGRLLAQGGLELRAQLELDGSRLDALVAFFPLPEAASLAVSPFGAEPFRAHATLSRTPDQLDLDEIALASARLRASGFVHRAASATQGALLLEMPLGSVGISLNGAGSGAVWDPPGDWLSRRWATSQRLSLE